MANTNNTVPPTFSTKTVLLTPPTILTLNLDTTPPSGIVSAKSVIRPQPGQVV